jgi:hypothetical protein
LSEKAGDKAQPLDSVALVKEFYNLTPRENVKLLIVP